VRTIARGEPYMDDPSKARSTFAVPSARLSDLSNREVEVLRLWVQGLSLEEIGVRLGVSEKTVANYQSLVRQKLDVQNDVQLLRMAEKLWAIRE
jgi:two-component system invasion response regulator UvrY